MTPNDTDKKEWIFWTSKHEKVKVPEGIGTMALDAKTENDGGIECLNEYGFERQNSEWRWI